MQYFLQLHQLDEFVGTGEMIPHLEKFVECDDTQEDKDKKGVTDGGRDALYIQVLLRYRFLRQCTIYRKRIFVMMINNGIQCEYACLTILKMISD